MAFSRIDQYRIIYNLPTYSFKEDVPGSFFLRYCNAIPYFVILVVVSRLGEFLFVPATNTFQAWQ